MSRTRTSILSEIKGNFMANATLQAIYGFEAEQSFDDVFSKVSLEYQMLDNLSFSIFVHEQIVEANAENSRPHNVPWYISQALNYHDGLELQWIDGQYQYDLTDVDDPELRKIIDRCAVLESDDSELVIKIATNNNGSIEPISPAQLVRFRAYMQQIKDAGNQLRIINIPADQLRMVLKVYVDEQIIDLDTGRQLNTDTEAYPVVDAINAYLANLEFNGGFVTQFMINTIQTTFQALAPNSIRKCLPVVEELQWKFAAFPFESFENWKIPEAGYFKIEPENLIITYEKYDLAHS